MKFRGLRVDGGGEIVGDLLSNICVDYVSIDFTLPAIANEDDILSVHPHTAAMSTGQTDKNGVEIFGSIPINGKMSKGGDEIRLSETVTDIVIFSEGQFKPSKATNYEAWNFLNNCEIIGKQYKR